MKTIWERNGLGRLMRRSRTRRTDEHSSSPDSENFEENANRISPKSKSRETEIGLECQLPENSHYKKDTPGPGESWGSYTISRTSRSPKIGAF